MASYFINMKSEDGNIIEAALVEELSMMESPIYGRIHQITGNCNSIYPN